MKLSKIIFLISTLSLSLLSLSAQAQKVDITKGQNIAGQVCAACHGADGNSTAAANPKLAAQHADYLYKQLANFKTKAGAKEPERPNAVMTGFANALSEQDMRDVAAFFQSQKLKPAAGKGDKKSLKNGIDIFQVRRAET